MTSLVRLYPQTWRDRYEDEFLALLAERPPDARDRVDIVRGALDARLRPQVRKDPGAPVPERPGGSLSGRSLGWITLAGGVVWLSALVIAINGPIVVDSHGTYRDGMAAVPFAFLAWVLLSVGLYGVATSLPSRADAGGLGVALAVVSGGIWVLGPWNLVFLVVANLGLVLVAIAARRTGVWGVLDTSILLGGLAISWIFGALPMMGIGGAPDPDGYLLFWVTMTSVWVAVGHALIAARGAQVAEEPAEDV